MRNRLRFGWIFFALAGLLLLAACGSDDPQQEETLPSLAVAQEDTEPIDSATAELITNPISSYDIAGSIVELEKSNSRAPERVIDAGRNAK